MMRNGKTPTYELVLRLHSSVHIKSWWLHFLSLLFFCVWLCQAGNSILWKCEAEKATVPCHQNEEEFRIPNGTGIPHPNNQQTLSVRVYFFLLLISKHTKIHSVMSLLHSLLLLILASVCVCVCMYVFHSVLDLFIYQNNIVKIAHKILLLLRQYNFFFVFSMFCSFIYHKNRFVVCCMTASERWRVEKAAWNEKKKRKKNYGIFTYTKLTSFFILDDMMDMDSLSQDETSIEHLYYFPMNVVNVDDDDDFFFVSLFDSNGFCFATNIIICQLVFTCI